MWEDTGFEQVIEQDAVGAKSRMYVYSVNKKGVHSEREKFRDHRVQGATDGTDGEGVFEGSRR